MNSPAEGWGGLDGSHSKQGSERERLKELTTDESIIS